MKTEDEIKPPLGLKPRWRHDEERRGEIQDAIMRYACAGMAIPVEWIAEYKELIGRANANAIGGRS